MNTEFTTHQIEQLLNSTRNDRSRGFDLSSYAINHLLENKGNEHAIVAYINKQLKPFRGEDDVYVYLLNVVSNISAEVLDENILFWMQTILDHKNDTIHSKRFTLIINLINIGKHNQDFNKLMQTKLLFQLLEECLSVGIESVYAGKILTCLTTCLEVYPVNCGTKRNQIESYLIQFLYYKTGNLGLLKKAGLCFQKLQQTGNPGADAINYKNNWKTAFEKLCVTLDILYDGFFDDVEEFYQYDKSTMVPYALPELPKVITAIEVLYVFESRLHNTSLFLRAMLENQYCCIKCICPQYVLDLITRVLVIHTCVKKSNSNTMFHFSMVLLKTQITVLYLLRSLIAILELNVIQFSTIISKLLIDCLTKTNSCSCFKHVGEYKEVLYKVLGYWIRSIRNCFNKNVHDKLITLIINDISPVIHQSLNMSSTTNKQTKEVKSNALIANMLSNPTKLLDSANDLCNPFKSKENTCYQSLCCLIMLFNNVNVCITNNNFVLLYDTVVQAILCISKEKKTFPYTSERIHLKLIEALVTLLDYSNAPPSVSLLINMLKNGEKSRHIRISNIFNENYKFLEKICQPISPSWDIKPHNEPYRNNELTPQYNEMLTKGQKFQVLPDKEQSNVSNNTSMENNTLVYEITQQSSGTVGDKRKQEIPEDKKQSNVSNNTCGTNDTLHATTKMSQNVSIQGPSTAIAGKRKKEKPKEVTDQNLFLNKHSEVEIYIDEETIGSTSNAVEDEFTQPAQKKAKENESNGNINRMLATFVDEVTDSIIPTQQM